jgi:hypothetical protein
MARGARAGARDERDPARRNEALGTALASPGVEELVRSVDLREASRPPSGDRGRTTVHDVAVHGDGDRWWASAFGTNDRDGLFPASDPDFGAAECALPVASAHLSHVLDLARRQGCGSLLNQADLIPRARVFWIPLWTRGQTSCDSVARADALVRVRPLAGAQNPELAPASGGA